MKKTALNLAIGLALLGSMQINQANAGVLTMFGSAGDLQASHGRSVGGIVIGGLVTLGGFALADSPSVGLRIAGIVLIVLDTKQQVRQELFEQYFAQRYPFIDDQDALANLSTLVKSTVEVSGGLNQSMTINIPASDTREALSNTSLSQAQIDQIVTDLM